LDAPETIAQDPHNMAETPLSAPGSKMKSMDRSLARSLAWRAAADWTSQIFSWASFFIVMRLLTPADFGIAGMAVILLSYLRWISDFGIQRTVVNLRNLGEEQLAQLNALTALMGFAGFALSALLAKPVALFFRTPGLAPVVMVTCSALIPWGFRAVPEGLLTKDLRFQSIAVIEASYAIVTAFVTLVLAFLHFGYWALALGNVIGVVVRSILVIRARPYRYATPHLASLRKALLFGWHVLVSMVAQNSYQRLDNVTAGRVLGQPALGVYSMAWNLANVPLEKITSLVTTVIPSYLAAVQEDAGALRRYLRTLTEAIALAAFPATVGLGLVARELIPLAFCQKWQGVIGPLEVLSVYAAFRSIVALLPKILTAAGNPRYVMWNDLAALVILPIAFYAGSHWGVIGIAWGWVAAYPVVIIPLYRKVFRTISMKTGEYFRAVRPALDGSLAMAAVVLGLKRVLPASQALLPRVFLEVAAGALTYTAIVMFFHRERALNFMRLAKTFRRK